MSSRRRLSAQSGIVLIIALIMLLVVTLIAVSASTMVRGNLIAIQNTESRERVRFAAHAAIEEALSSRRFFESPASIFASPCQRNNRKCYDFNEDGRDDVLVDVAPPSCVLVIPLQNAQLNVFGAPAHAGCFLPQARYSLCANSVWEIEATATDAATDAKITVRQGASVLTALNQIATICPV